MDRDDFSDLSIAILGSWTDIPKNGLLDTMRKRREETQSRKIQWMREVLTKQGLIIYDSTIDIEEKITEVPLWFCLDVFGK